MAKDVNILSYGTVPIAWSASVYVFSERLLYIRFNRTSIVHKVPRQSLLEMTIMHVCKKL